MSQHCFGGDSTQVRPSSIAGSSEIARTRNDAGMRGRTSGGAALQRTAIRRVSASAGTVPSGGWSTTVYRNVDHVDRALPGAAGSPGPRGLMLAGAINALLWLSPCSAASIAVSGDTAPPVAPDGQCSLIEAIVNANGDAAIHSDCNPGSGADAITLPSGSTQVITAVNNTRYGATGLPVVTTDITLIGNGSTITRASDSPSFRIFAVTGRLAINGLIVSGGQLPAWDPVLLNNGGCGILLVHGTVEVKDSALSDNRCFYRGGAIYNNSGRVTLIRTTLTRNSGETGGGLGQYRGNARVVDSLISENVASKYDGGGIYSGASTLEVERSTVKGNEADYGGGIRQEWDSRAVINDSSIIDNRAKISGGGIENGAFSSLLLSNSTVAGNESMGSGGGVTGTMAHNGTLIVSSTLSGNRAAESGGGIWAWGEGVTTVTRSTIALNHAGVRGGGLHSSNSPFILSNTLVSGNTSDGDGPEFSCNGNLCERYATVNHHNLFGHEGHSGLAGLASGARDIIPDVPLSSILDVALNDNGGPTRTHALPAASPAIDAGDPDFEKVIHGRGDIYDQRGTGFPRLAGPHMDIGALESPP